MGRTFRNQDLTRALFRKLLHITSRWDNILTLKTPSGILGSY